MKKESQIFLLESQLRDREFEIAMLRETAEAISGELSLDNVFQVVADHARKLILAETVLIPVLDEKLAQYTYRAGCGKNADEIVGQSLPLDTGVCGWVWRNKRPWWHGVLKELSEEERNRWEKEAGTIILVPLIGKRHFLGGIAGINKIGSKDFTQRDLDLLTLFAHQVSYTIENAELFDQLTKSKLQSDEYQRELQALNTELERRVAQRTTALADAVKELEHLAMHDMLTDLPNRSLVEDRLQQGIHIAKREKKVISLMMIDLNRFKEVNDKHGHDAGDSLLKQVAMRLRRILRQSDTAGRLGGDEFAIVLPSTDAAGAMKVAEKLLKVMESPFKVGENSLSIACSVGIAMYPQHGGDVAGLCRNADVAMYAAKRSGRGYAIYRPGDEKNMM
ncbi:MAG: sensor domain-containing diguanylate cyclase [Sulfuricaulis sp.]|uniref:sensor domain-containing diguanylate cyclase n=1 Tax=Sulfuricaulis sp. TaxID=2003553 RepID=UPI0025EFEFF6|nr:sensor domain-containing diguanylate cyclase [Sulfuricaulis sp.]MCR4346373.1 sensor domain-containing diguanylate cyclase [Sulfuricaulis sp.]